MKKYNMCGQHKRKGDTAKEHFCALQLTLGGLAMLILAACQNSSPPTSPDRSLAGFYRIQEFSQNGRSCNSPGPTVERYKDAVVRLASDPGPDASATLLECDTNCKCRFFRSAGFRSRASGSFAIYKNHDVCEVNLVETWTKVNLDTVVVESRRYRKTMTNAVVCDIDVERETFRKQENPCVSRETIVLALIPNAICPSESKQGRALSKDK